MLKKKFVGIIGFLILVAVVLAGIWFYSSRALKKTFPPIPVGANKALAEHSKIFKKGVEKVGGNIFVAIGYGIANSIMNAARARSARGSRLNGTASGVGGGMRSSA